MPKLNQTQINRLQARLNSMVDPLCVKIKKKAQEDADKVFVKSPNEAILVDLLGGKFQPLREAVKNGNTARAIRLAEVFEEPEWNKKARAILESIHENANAEVEAIHNKVASTVDKAVFESTGAADLIEEIAAFVASHS